MLAMYQTRPDAFNEDELLRVSTLKETREEKEGVYARQAADVFFGHIVVLAAVFFNNLLHLEGIGMTVGCHGLEHGFPSFRA